MNANDRVFILAWIFIALFATLALMFMGLSGKVNDLAEEFEEHIESGECYMQGYHACGC